MKLKHFIIQFISTLLIAIAMLLTFYCFQQKLYISTVILSLFALGLLLQNGWSFRKTNSDIEKTLQSVLYKDFSLFPQKNKGNTLKNKVIEVYLQAQKENTKQLSYKLLYENILDKMEISLLILEQSLHHQDWQVFYCNTAFLETMNVPKYKLWVHYAQKIPVFYTLIEEKKHTDTQDFFDINIQNRGKQTYSVRTSALKIPYGQFCVVSLESIQRIIDKKEKMAWNNLMQVIAHELLNTLTPVNSLIENLGYLSKQEEINADDRQEMCESINIINLKSQQLLHFINDYRQVAELPKPKLTNVSLSQCIQKSVHLFQKKIEQENITIHQNLQEINIQVDEKMLERALVNLLLNAFHAVENNTEKQISISCQRKEKRILIQVLDNGTGIPEEIKDKVFLPFFTTRDKGSGIGLTLTKSIIEAHNGYINQQNTPQGCLFEIAFVTH